MKLFQELDRNRNGTLASNELYDFMNRQFLSPTYQDVDDIVYEYDGSQDRRINFDEFSHLVLPATDQNSRHLASTRRYSPYYRASDPCTYSVLSKFGSLLQSEKQLQRTRNDQKRQLTLYREFSKVGSFDQISRGFREGIMISDLVAFCQLN